MKADLELVQELKDGDDSAFSELVKRHQKALLRMCLRILRDQDLAEDVVQDSFIKAYRKIHSFEGRSAFKSWLFQIAVNTARNKLRGMKREVVDIDKVSLSVGATAEKGLIQDVVKEALLQQVERLPDKQRTALMLRIYEDMSFKEIAQVMDCPYDTAKANYRHGLLKVKEAFKDDASMKGLFKLYSDATTISLSGNRNEVET